MEMKSLLPVLVVAIFAGIVMPESLSDNRDLTREPGHLKPFGTGRPIHLIDEIQDFPNSKTFLTDHVFASRPLKMKGAAKLSPAFKLWTDDYFLSLNLVPEESTVHLETLKKETRTQDTEEMPFKDFIKIYNKTEHYMVDEVPGFLRKDIVFPCAVQCSQLMEENVVAAMMWFSSGGTNSVVHADAVDNINCLFRGDKTFVMVDTNKYRSKVDLDHPEGLYSSMDVDSVDYTKFPGLAEVEFYHVNVTAGDCLYIPYRWIHQVRSYSSNLAVNIWWDHHDSRKTDLSTCRSGCDTSITLKNIDIHGMNAIMDTPGTIRDQFINIIALKNLSFEDFRKSMAFGEWEAQDSSEQGDADAYNSLVKEFFGTLDPDSDGMITQDDVDTLPEQAWEDAQTYMMEIGQMLHGDRRGEEDEDLDYQHDEYEENEHDEL